VVPVLALSHRSSGSCPIMPEAWSSRFDRERSKDVRRRERDEQGTSEAEAEKEAEGSFITETDEPRGRRVAD
jgi:predicted RNA polymerase sigma factor